MDPVLSYNFAEIDAVVLRDIQSTSAQLSAHLDDLRSRSHPAGSVDSRGGRRLPIGAGSLATRGRGTARDLGQPGPGGPFGGCGYG